MSFEGCVDRSVQRECIPSSRHSCSASHKSGELCDWTKLYQQAASVWGLVTGLFANQKLGGREVQGREGSIFTSVRRTERVPSWGGRGKREREREPLSSS